MRNYKYFWSLTPGIVAVFGNLAGGWWGMSNLIFSLGVLAFVEWFFPDDKKNESTASAFVPNLILAMHVVMQVLVLSSFFYAISVNKFSAVQLFFACLSTGVHSGSSSIVVAHELIHRKEKGWQLAGKFLLLTAGNIYFFIQHLRVHHKRVGLPDDPASARYNESLYAFFFRTSGQQIKGAWRLECERMRKENKIPFHPSNYLVSSLILLALIAVVLWFTAGPVAVLAFAGQCVVANFLLEYTNYIEHYGLKRNENERVREIHSWQSDKVISRFFLIDLSRHSDHHYYASKPYHELVSHEKSPVLPGGYASAIYLALIPPLWFRIINARIDRFQKSVVPAV